MKAEDVDGALVRRASGGRVPTTDEIRNWATYVPDTSVGMHVSERDAAAFDWWLAGHDREVAARVLNAEADEMERYAEATYWRDDSPFHAQGMTHAVLQAQRTRERAARLAAATEGLTTCLPSLGEPCGSCHRCTEPQGGS